MNPQVSESNPHPKRRFRLCFSLFTLMLLMLIVAGGIKWWITPAKVDVVTMVRIREPRIPFNDPAGFLAPVDHERFLAAQPSIVTSPGFLTEFIQRNGMEDDPMHLQQRIHASLVEGSDLLEIRMSANEEDAEETARLLDDIVNRYGDSLRRTEAEELDESIMNLERQLHESTARVERIATRLRDNQDLQLEGDGSNTDEIDKLEHELAREQKFLDQIDYLLRTSQANREFIRRSERITVVYPATIRRGR